MLAALGSLGLAERSCSSDLDWVSKTWSLAGAFCSIGWTGSLFAKESDLYQALLYWFTTTGRLCGQTDTEQIFKVSKKNLGNHQHWQTRHRVLQYFM